MNEEKDLLLTHLVRMLFVGMEGEARLRGSDMAAHMPTLYLLAHRSVGPIVECGVGKGFSTLALLAGAIDTGLHLTSYDTNPRCEEEALKNMGVLSDEPKREALRQSWTFVHGHSLKSASLWPDKSIGLWFLDTSHHYENTTKELELWFPKIQAAGIMCGHDYLLKNYGVKQAVDEFVARNEKRFRLQVCPPSQGFFILWPS